MEVRVRLAKSPMSIPGSVMASGTIVWARSIKETISRVVARSIKITLSTDKPK
jgi:hypothetical protein